MNHKSRSQLSTLNPQPSTNLNEMTDLLKQLGRKGVDPERITDRMLKNPPLLDELVEGLQAEAARVRFGCAKILRLVAERQPGLLYPRFDFFVRLLDSENKIFQWEASFVLSHLARVDRENKFDAIFERYFAPIPGPVMITAANVIGGAARIALAKPHLADRIAAEVLKVERARYQTAECRNVAIGHAILSFAAFFGALGAKAPVVKFVQRQLKNSRNATRKKAEQFLKRNGESTNAHGQAAVN